jgi:hypothetical protein
MNHIDEFFCASMRNLGVVTRLTTTLSQFLVIFSKFLCLRHFSKLNSPLITPQLTQIEVRQMTFLSDRTGLQKTVP